MKLYGLYIVEKEDSFMQLTAASNEVNKLKAVIHAPGHKFYVRKATEDNKKVCYTDEDKYPRYVIYEIPYIC